MVLLPATGTTADDWDAIADSMSRDRLVYCPDLRGHGRSDWPGDYSLKAMANDVVGMLDALGGPVDLVGHSMGGLVACLVASRRPDLVCRLVLEDVGLLRPRAPQPPARPEGDLDFDWRVVEQVRPEVDQPDPAWRDTAARIAVPTLVIGGGASSFLPQDQVADLARTIPDARQVTIDAGHLVHATQPAAFVSALRSFVDAAAT
jgi:pimeloyl-ACP methyl ester carboxylesterase